nr:hypothetical protein GCM10020093_095210 [Planobispora longispora]
MLGVRTRPRWTDRMLPLIVGAAQVASNYGAEDNQPDRLPADPFGVSLLLAGPLALAMRRSHPVSTLLVTLATTFVFIIRGHAYGPIFFSPVIALYFTVVLGHRRVAWAASVVAYAFFVVYTNWLAPVPSPGLWHTIAIAAVMGIVLAVGEFVRARKERAAEHARVTEEESRRQASEERLTMAQELHDVLAHNISLIHVQASTALHLIDDHPEQARTALTTIKQASKEVLTEMRSLIGVLRDGAPRSPRAGWTGSTSWPGGAASTSPGASPAGPGRSRPGWTWPGTASRRSPSPTSPGTLPAPPSSSCWSTAPASCSSASPTPGGHARREPGRRQRHPRDEGAGRRPRGTLTAGRHGRGFRVEARLPIPEETP